MISNLEILKEIKKLKKNQKKILSNEISLVVLTCVALILNLIFAILVYFVFSKNEIRENQ
jgi:riboflavin transporter FmnP